MRLTRSENSRAMRPLLPTEALSDRLVDHDRDAVADDLVIAEPQRLLVARLAEEALAGAQHDGEHHQPNFVDEVELEQRLRQLRAAVDDDVAVDLLLEL